MFQSEPVEELHSDERFAVVVVNFMDGADVRVIEGRGGPGFTLEAGQRFGVFGNSVGEKLEGHKPAEFQILGLIDHAHSATT